MTLAATFALFGCVKEANLTADNQIRILDQHDTRRPLGKGRLFDKPHGLEIKAQLNLKVPAARGVYEHMKDGVLDGLSIGYTILPNGSEMKSGVRYLKGIHLHEVSVVTFGMNRSAKILTVKSAQECGNIREFEDLARDALGLSARQAKRLASVGWPAINHAGDRDDPGDGESELGEVVSKLNTLTDYLKGSS